MPQETELDYKSNPGHDPVVPVNGTGGGGPGGREAGAIIIAGLALYLVLFTVFVIYGLVKIWPGPTPSRESAPGAAASPSPSATASPSPSPRAGVTQSPPPTPPLGQTQSPAQPGTSPAASQVSPTSSPTASPSPSPSPCPSPSPPIVTIFGWQFGLEDEQRLLLLVLLGGALGTLVHSLRSVYWYVGNRNLIVSWMAMYFMLPFAGSALALVFYLVIRGGFFSPQSSFQQTSPFGFAAFAALIGMFSSQAVLKLKDVAEVMLSKPSAGANSKPQGSTTPVVQPVPPTPPPQPEGAPPPPPPAGDPPAVG